MRRLGSLAVGLGVPGLLLGCQDRPASPSPLPVDPVPTERWVLDDPVTDLDALPRIVGDAPDATLQIAGVGDLDGDGESDILAITDNHPQRTARAGQLVLGEGAYRHVVLTVLAGEQLRPVAHDVTGDALADVVFRGAEPWPLQVWSGGQVAATVPALFDEAPFPASVASGDLTGDGVGDLLLSMVHPKSPQLWIVPGPLAGEVQIEDAIVLALDQDGSSAVGDFDGDGVHDIFHRNRDALALIHGPFDRGESGLHLLRRADLVVHNDGVDRVFALADLDGDGDDEIGLDRPYTSFDLVLGGAVETLTPARSFAVQGAGTPAVLTDLEAGAPGLAIGDFGLGDGEVRVVPRPLAMEEEGWTYHGREGSLLGVSLAVADLDGDGRVELAMAAPAEDEHAGAVYIAAMPALVPEP